MPRSTDLLAIGEVARRSGCAPSALRHCEMFGLIASHRTAGNRRLYERAVLRRLAVVRAGQRVGLSPQDTLGADGRPGARRLFPQPSGTTPIG